MKRKFSIMLICIECCFIFSSCASSTYQQIATLQSEQVQMESGKFVDRNDFVTVEYDFWEVAGKVSFLIFNHTSEDVYLDLSKSFYLKNGYAYDYYQNRIFTNSSSVVSSSMSSVAVASSVYSSSSISSFFGAGTNTSASISEYKKYDVQYVEQSVVCIPANSSKRFCEFNVFPLLYRECGFGRFPSSKELSVKEFNIESSPIVIENRLVFVKNNVELPVKHVFYISQFQNIAKDDALVESYPKDCQGRTSVEPVYYHKLSGPNKFYTIYYR